MTYRPESRVRITPETRRDGTVREYAVRLWFAPEGWGTIRSKHPTQEAAEAAAAELRRQIGETDADELV